MKGLVDTHIHTHFSHDSKADPEMVCLAAVERSLTGITITDHCDVELQLFEAQPQIKRSVETARRLKAEFDGRLRVFAGVEMGVSPESRETAMRIIDGLGELDQIIFSVHCLTWRGEFEAFSRLDFSAWSEGEINDYLSLYFDTVLYGLQSLDADILPHVTCPVKYLAKYGKTVDLSRFSDKITEILRLVIKKRMALELNSSSVVDESVIDRYIELGGSLFTLGSDAHVPEGVGNAFDKHTELLRAKGIKKVCYFRERKPISIDI